MSPEQAEGRPAGPEADVYSLALMLYECWSGENPNRRATPAATARAIGARHRPLRRLRPDLPRELSADDRRLPRRPPQPPALAGGARHGDRGLARPARRRHPAAPARHLGLRLGALAAAAAPRHLARGRPRRLTSLGFSDQRPAQPRVPDRRPRRGGLQPRLQLRGAAGRTGPQAGQGNGRAQDRLGPARLRAQRVHRLPLDARTGPSSRATSARSSRSSPATCSSTRAAAATTC